MTNANAGIAADETYSVTLSFPFQEMGASAQLSSIIAHGDAMPPDDLTDAKLAAAEARTDTKIVRLEGKIDTLAATITGQFASLTRELDRTRDETRDSRLILMATIIGSALSLAVLFVALWTYGDALFGRGMNVRDVVQAVVKEQQIQQQQLPSRTTTPPNTR